MKDNTLQMKSTRIFKKACRTHSANSRVQSTFILYATLNMLIAPELTSVRVN